MHSRKPVIASLNRLMAFAQWVRVRRMIEEIAREPKQTFWNMTMNLLFDMATIEWVMVFGSHSQDTHWKKVIAADQHDETHAALLKHLGMTAAEWRAARDSIVTYRNEHVAHHDVKSRLRNLPHYDAALKAAFFMFKRIRALADPGWLGEIPTDL